MCTALFGEISTKIYLRKWRILCFFKENDPKPAAPNRHALGWIPSLRHDPLSPSRHVAANWRTRLAEISRQKRTLRMQRSSSPLPYNKLHDSARSARLCFIRLAMIQTVWTVVDVESLGIFRSLWQNNFWWKVFSCLVFVCFCRFRILLSDAKSCWTGNNFSNIAFFRASCGFFRGPGTPSFRIHNIASLWPSASISRTPVIHKSSHFSKLLEAQMNEKRGGLIWLTGRAPENIRNPMLEDIRNKILKIKYENIWQKTNEIIYQIKY